MSSYDGTPQKQIIIKTSSIICIEGLILIIVQIIIILSFLIIKVFCQGEKAIEFF